MTSRQRVIAALNRQKPDRVPFMEWYYDVEVFESIMGKKDYTRDEIADVMQMDGRGTYMGPEVYARKGVSSAGQEYELGGLLKTRDSLSMIRLSNPSDPAIYDGIKRDIDGNRKDRFIFWGTNIGLDPLIRGMGIDNFSYAMYDDPGLIEAILDIYTDWAAEAVEQVQKLGVDAVWYADDIAYNNMLMFSPDFFREVMKPRLKKVTDRVKLPLIYHSDGYMLPVLDDLIDLGFCAFHPNDPNALDMADVKRQYGDRLCLIGNIDLGYTLVSGTAQEVRAEVKDRIETVGYNGGYIVSTANSITNYCNPANLLAMRDAVLEFGRL